MPPSVKEGVVLTQAELDLIRAKVRKTPETDADARRRHLKTLSDERVRHWPNTLEAHRQNKENWKKKQEEAIEAKRREVDQEEALLQRKLRAETIKRANDKLYEQTGKMKLLRSNLLYAEVIETRKDQIAEKEEERQAGEVMADAYHREIKRKVVEGEAKEKERADARKQKSKGIEEMQKLQLKAFQEEFVASLIKEKEDGDTSQREAKAALEVEAEQAKTRKMNDKKEMGKMLAANQDLHARRADRIAEELEYMEKCRNQCEVLDRAARARKDLETKRFDERQAIRQEMIDKATAELETTRTAGDKKEEREALEQRQKEDNAAEKKNMAREQLRLEIDKSRAIQMKQKADKEAARQAGDIDIEIKAYFKERTNEVKRLDKEEEAARLAREKQLRASQQTQARELRAKKMALQAYETVKHARMLTGKGEEDSRFRKIVNGYMDEFESRGQSTYLLHRTLNHKNPEMFPAGNLKL